MLLDDLQTAVLKVLSRNRTPQSVFAGGAVLQRYGHRLSDDQDIFTDVRLDLYAIAEADIALLETYGFPVRKTMAFEGFAEVEVGTAQQGFTRVQWVQSAEWNFFGAVPDAEFGWRLHYADLAVNKVLAAAGRKEVRDFIDLSLIHAAILPLWHALWAAPGKDEEWSPGSLAERIAANCGFRTADLEGVVTTEDVDIGAVCRGVRMALDEAKEILPTLPIGTAGRLFVAARGEVVTDPVAVRGSSVEAVGAIRGGAWPSGPDIDGAIVRRVMRESGRTAGSAQRR